MENDKNYSYLLNEIEKGKIKNLYLFYEKESYLKQEAIEKIISILIPPGLKSFNLDILRGKEADSEKIINTVSTFPFGAEKRVVVVYEMDKLPQAEKDALLKFLSHFSSKKKNALAHCCLILATEKQDFRLKFYKELKEIGEAIEFRPLYDNQIPSWIERRARIYKKKIAPEGAQILQEIAGNSLPTLDNEIRKLITYVGEREIIKKEDVEVVAGASLTNNVFQLNEAVGERDLKKAISILNNLFLSGEKPGGIIFWLTEHFIRLFKVKTLDGNRGEIASILKTTYPKIISKYLAQAENFEIEQLKKGLVKIYQADLEVKSSSLPNKTILELLVYNLCNL
jgi:DNA polymerase-3 subunit delta